ncbi:hypothetical protein I6G82_12515 [Lysinibacillus macroides]|uniref:hypothetical protein n=1 Tax=Lysinibacillus macroides TaxID=33935 RepID=UPI0006B548E2|nr:hypothetical protein [Lysinibacillus macroides]QPR66125.1 hypothetical protein I6G82_12515 [Lysinibacillus macroides]
MDSHFTYQHFIKNNDFVLLNPVFIVLLLFSILLLVIALIKKVSIWLCTLFASLTIIVAAQLLWFSGIIADELGIGGSAQSFSLFIGIFIIQCLTLWIAIKKNAKKVPQRSADF